MSNLISGFLAEGDSAPLLPRQRDIEAATQALGALSNPQRLQILCHLVHEGELSVQALNQRLDLSQSALSQHLAKLRNHDLVETRKERQTVYYTVACGKARRIVALLHELYCGR